MAASPPPRRPGAHDRAPGRFGPPPRPGTAVGAQPSPHGAKRVGGGPARAARPRGSVDPRWWILGLVLVALLVAGGFALVQSRITADPVHPPLATSAAPSPTGAPTASAPSPASPEPAAPAEPEPTDPAPPMTDPDSTLAVLDSLVESSGESAWEYRRDAFGQPWEDVDGNGCSTRNDILARDLVDPVFPPGSAQCKVLAGTLTDPYDGRMVPFVFGQQTSQEVPIDHVVALAWAWRHGADAWTPERRLVFANDPENLLAVAQENNQTKLAKGPSQWLPADAARSCMYIEKWLTVLDDYDLGINAADRAAARAVIERC